MITYQDLYIVSNTTYADNKASIDSGVMVATWLPGMV